MIATLLPSSSRAWRIAWSAIAPTALALAASRLTLAGTCATRLRGTALYSAWVATPSPMHATRSPTRNSSTCEPDRHHGSGAAVAKGGRRLEAFLHLAERRDQALLPERVEHQLDLVGALLRLLREAHARLGDFHLLGAHAHERVVISHEHVAGAERGHWHLADVQGAVAKIVADLLHIVLDERQPGGRAADQASGFSRMNVIR